MRCTQKAHFGLLEEPLKKTEQVGAGVRVCVRVCVMCVCVCVCVCARAVRVHDRLKKSLCTLKRRLRQSKKSVVDAKKDCDTLNSSSTGLDPQVLMT